MANVDQANFDSNAKHGVNWSSAYSVTAHSVIGAVSEDDGRANTDTIVDVFPNDNTSNNATWLCHTYRDPEGHEGVFTSSS